MFCLAQQILRHILVLVTRGSTRTVLFRWVVAFSKRCIFLHTLYEKLISEPYKEVYISTFLPVI